MSLTTFIPTTGQSSSRSPKKNFGANEDESDKIDDDPSLEMIDDSKK